MREEFHEAIEVWKQTLPDGGSRVKATADRFSKYRARRRDGYSHEIICQALRNYVHDDWEERTTSPSAREFSVLLRNGAQVEKFAAMKAKKGPKSDSRFDHGDQKGYFNPETGEYL